MKQTAKNDPWRGSRWYDAYCRAVLEFTRPAVERRIAEARTAIDARAEELADSNYARGELAALEHAREFLQLLEEFREPGSGEMA